MMQTLLTQTPSAPANGLDKAPLSGSVESKSIDGGAGSDSKGDFATLIAKAQNSEQGAAEASQGDNNVRSAKSLATESTSPKEEVSKEQDPDTDSKVEEVPATDFLLRLQDSLKLDTSLVTPQLAVAAQQSTTAVDGNPLPQESEQESIALDESEPAPAAAGIARQLAGQTGAQSPLATTAQSTPETTVSSSSARVVVQGDASSAVLSPAALSPEGEKAATTADEPSGEKPLPREKPPRMASTPSPSRGQNEWPSWPRCCRSMSRPVPPNLRSHSQQKKLATANPTPQPAAPPNPLSHSQQNKRTTVNPTPQPAAP